MFPKCELRHERAIEKLHHLAPPVATASFAFSQNPLSAGSLLAVAVATGRLTWSGSQRVSFHRSGHVDVIRTCLQPACAAPVGPNPRKLRAMSTRQSGILKGLAGQWEEDRSIRRGARETGRLVHWPTPESVGIASMSHACTSHIRV